MERFAEHLSPLTKFAIAIGFAVLLPQAIEPLHPPSVLDFIVAGILVRPNMLVMRRRGLAQHPATETATVASAPSLKPPL